MKVWFLKVHRWLALLFALPLIAVIISGLVLSFEPWVVARAVEPGSLSAQKIQALLAQHDPAGRARSIAHRAYDHAIVLGSGPGGGGIVIDVASGAVQPGPSTLASVFATSKGLHVVLLLSAGWLVTASTVAMLVIAVLGILWGWPKFNNTLGGWHKAMSWGLLPLIVLSPLTGLLMVAGVTFQTMPPSAPAGQGAPLQLLEAVEIVGRDHDLSSLVWIRPMGGRVLARLAESGEQNLYVVTREGAAAVSRNWPRLWHEGTFAGVLGTAMNVIISIAMIGLLVTGYWIWVRRKIRMRARRAVTA
jgi:uncharacterized iron-regulated membrane protein